MICSFKLHCSHFHTKCLNLLVLSRVTVATTSHQYFFVFALQAFSAHSMLPRLKFPTFSGLTTKVGYFPFHSSHGLIFQWYKVLLYDLFQCNRLMKWCTAPDCNNAIKVSHVEARPVKCRCSHQFCFACGERWHDPVRSGPKYH